VLVDPPLLFLFLLLLMDNERLLKALLLLQRIIIILLLNLCVVCFSFLFFFSDEEKGDNETKMRRDKRDFQISIRFRGLKKRRDFLKLLSLSLSLVVSSELSFSLSCV